jgi:hypothetical protein
MNKSFYIKPLTISVLCCLFAVSLYGQSKYIGLQKESSVLEEQLNVMVGSYWPKFQLIDNEIYAATPNGIYRKNLNTLSDTLWQLYAFEGIPIRDFVKKNNHLVAITSNETDSFLVYSDDNGSSFEFRNDAHFTDSLLVHREERNTIHQIGHNLQHLDSILVAHHFGISLSTDTGKTWSLLTKFAPNGQYRFIDFHPTRKERIYSAGETGFMSSYLHASNNGGKSWSTIFDEHNDCAHFIAFHPEDEDIYLLGREGRISKTTDGGSTWSSFNLSPYLYIYQIEYDLNNPNVVYASGGLNGLYDTVYFMKSYDSGDSWEVIHQEMPMEGFVGQVLDFKILGNTIIYRTAFKGFYTLNTEILSSTNNYSQPRIQVYPIPASHHLNIQSDQALQHIELYDSKGQLIKVFAPYKHSCQIEVRGLEPGIYFLKIEVGNQFYTKRFLMLS